MCAWLCACVYVWQDLAALAAAEKVASADARHAAYLWEMAREPSAEFEGEEGRGRGRGGGGGGDDDSYDDSDGPQLSEAPPVLKKRRCAIM